MVSTCLTSSALRCASSRAASRPARPARGAVQCSAVKLPVRSLTEKLEIPAHLKPVVAAAVANLIMAAPAGAVGKLFDFGATLPAIAAEFLLLMVFLEKFFFTPVGKVLDERDKMIRDKLASVRDNSGELRKLQEEAEGAIKDARAEAQATIQKAKAEIQAEQGDKFSKAKEQVDKELAAAITRLEGEKDAAFKQLDKQVAELVSRILSRVLPEGVKL